MLVWKPILLIVGILGLVVLLCAAAVLVERKYPGEAFDERQKIAKGRGYRLSFWVGMAYNFCVALILLQQVDGEKTIEPYLLVMIGAILQAIVDHTYCVITHSALPLSQNRKSTILGYITCAILQFIQFPNLKARDGFALVGHGTSAWMCLIAGCCLVYLALLHIIQALLDRKE